LATSLTITEERLRNLEQKRDKQIHEVETKIKAVRTLRQDYKRLLETLRLNLPVTQEAITIKHTQQDCYEALIREQNCTLTALTEERTKLKQTRINEILQQADLKINQQIDSHTGKQIQAINTFQATQFSSVSQKVQILKDLLSEQQRENTALLQALVDIEDLELHLHARESRQSREQSK
jgi:hypothetical protein